MRLALCIAGSTFLLGLIATHIPKFAWPFDEPAFPRSLLFLGY
jgi:hypothetical protein